MRIVVVVIHHSLQLADYIIRPHKFSIILKMSLTAVVLAHYSNSALLFTYSAPSSRKGLNDQAKLIASKAKFLKARVGERDKLKGELGNWYVVRTTETLLMAACVNEDYPERLAYGLLQKLHSIIQDKPPRDDESQRKIKGVSKDLTAVCQKYRDACVDKVKEAQKAVNELQADLNFGVKKLIGNKQTLEDMNDKASLMKDYAKAFEKNSGQLQKAMCWRKYKFCIVIGVVLVGVFVAAGLTIYFKTH